MIRDYVNELQQLNHSKCHIKDKQRVNKMISEIIDGGTKRLQVVSDFDRTITKQHDDGKIHLSSFGIFARCRSLPPTYLEDERQLTNKYLPIEINPDIPFPDKKALMEEWWNLSEKLLVGLSVSEKDLDDVVSEVAMSLRDNCVDTFTFLDQHSIPLLVFSAGIGDVVVAILKYYKVLFPNVKVISNFLQRDEDDKLQGFNGKMINVFNKNELALHGTPYYELIANRCNVILMGDSIGDAGMADGLPNCNAVLKIGFLYDHVAGNLPSYMDNFDIVLEDDQTMNVLHSILQLLDTSTTTSSASTNAQQ